MEQELRALLLAGLDGDASAYRAFLQRLSTLLRGYFRRRLQRLPDEVEDAVVQVMTYLVENENAALLVPARFLGQMHPHFREVLQCLAITIADEAVLRAREAACAASEDFREGRQAMAERRPPVFKGR